MTAEKSETKDRIVEVARELFSLTGYDGTSVRQIAEKSGVNLAAINYHFGSKHGLYWAVIMEAHEWLHNATAKLVEESEDFEALSRGLFRILRKDDHYIRSSMKMFLTEGVPAPDDDHPYRDHLSKAEFGPPGAELIFDFIKKTQKNKIANSAIEWAVMSIFSNIIHMATMCSTSAFQEIKKGRKTDKQIEDNIAELSHAILAHISK